jgi:transcription initiation factor TFIIIB Brf1 subunit/transcription initiation factor TFIIB
MSLFSTSVDQRGQTSIFDFKEECLEDKVENKDEERGCSNCGCTSKHEEFDEVLCDKCGLVLEDEFLTNTEKNLAPAEIEQLMLEIHKGPVWSELTRRIYLGSAVSSTPNTQSKGLSKNKLHDRARHLQYLQEIADIERRAVVKALSPFYFKIKYFRDRLDLSTSACVEAAYICRNMYESQLNTGRHHEIITAAALYITAEQGGNRRPVSSFTDHLIDANESIRTRKNVINVIKLMSSTFGYDVLHPDIRDTLESTLDNFEMDWEVKHRAREIVEGMYHEEYINRAGRKTWVGAAIIEAHNLLGKEVQKKKLANMVGVTDQAIRTTGRSRVRAYLAKEPIIRPNIPIFANMLRTNSDLQAILATECKGVEEDSEHGFYQLYALSKQSNEFRYTGKREFENPHMLVAEKIIEAHILLLEKEKQIAEYNTNHLAKKSHISIDDRTKFIADYCNKNVPRFVGYWANQDKAIKYIQRDLDPDFDFGKVTLNPEEQEMTRDYDIYSSVRAAIREKSLVSPHNQYMYTLVLSAMLTNELINHSSTNSLELAQIFNSQKYMKSLSDLLNVAEAGQLIDQHSIHKRMYYCTESLYRLIGIEQPDSIQHQELLVSPVGLEVFGNTRKFKGCNSQVEPSLIPEVERKPI